MTVKSDLPAWDIWIERIEESEGKDFADAIRRYVADGPKDPFRCAYCGSPFEVGAGAGSAGAEKQRRFCRQACTVAFHANRPLPSPASGPVVPVDDRRSDTERGRRARAVEAAYGDGQLHSWDGL